MPVKTKRIHHRAPHDKSGHRRARHFLKVYAPYIPLLLIVGLGFAVSFNPNLKTSSSHVLSYATGATSNNLLEATNKQRSNQGLSELSLNTQLSAAAQTKAQDMANHNYWSHNTPDGKEPWYFMQQAGYSYSKAAENLAYGFNSSAEAVVGWMNSPTHRANIVDGELSEVGFGMVNAPNYQNEGPQTIVVALYGTPPKPVAPATTSPTPTPPVLVVAPPNPQKISLAQSLTGGWLPWINLALGMIIGIIIVYLVMTHSLRLRRALRRGQRFILHHPLLDITLIALAGLLAILTQTTGIIH